MPRGGSDKSRQVGDKVALEVSWTGSGVGVGQRRSQAATRPLRACKGMRYRRNGRASGDMAVRNKEIM